jgi:hypothetical protein
VDFRNALFASHPFPQQAVSNISIRFKPNPVIGVKLRNVHRVSRELPQDSGPCDCATFKQQLLRKYSPAETDQMFCEGHLVSGDHRVLPAIMAEPFGSYTELLFKEGNKFRLRKSLLEVLAGVAESLTAFADRVAAQSRCAIADSAVAEWIASACDRVGTILFTSLDQNRFPMPQPGFCHALSSLHSKVVITTQDKNPQGFFVRLVSLLGC